MAVPKIEFDSFGVSDLGIKRSVNQDQFVIADLRRTLQVRQSSFNDKPRKAVRSAARGRLLLVADGMGGMAEGARASRIVVETFMRFAVSALSWITPGDELNRDEVTEELIAATRCCRRRLEREAQDARVMGTTLTVAYVAWPDLFVLHVGDSRCYLHRAGALQQLTTDHTIAQRLADEGAIDGSTAANSPFAHVLWNSISNAPKGELKPQVVARTLQTGDVLVLCTDGLTRHVTDARIGQAAGLKSGAKVKAERLVEQARAGGGADNISVIVSQQKVTAPKKRRTGPLEPR